MLSPQAGITDFEKQFSKRDYTYILHNQTYTVIARYIGNLSQEKGAYILGWVTGIVGTLILLVGLINFFHFLIGSFLNRTKEYAIMKMLGADWKRLFCLLLIQSLIVVFASSFLVVWGVELIGDRMDFSLPGLTMNFPSETLLKHILQYIVLLVLLVWQSACSSLSVFADFPYKQVYMEAKSVVGNNGDVTLCLASNF